MGSAVRLSRSLTLCHKHSDGWVRSTLPDVCKRPTIPELYTDVAYARDLAKGTTTVLSHDGAMNGLLGRLYPARQGPRRRALPESRRSRVQVHDKY